MLRAGNTAHADRPPIEEMYAVHRLFRREFSLIPRLIRATADGDTGRATVVADHLRTGRGSLHVHHDAEEVELWPRLRDRARPPTALVAELLAQHERVEAADLRIGPLLDSWTVGASAVRGEQLARAVEEMRAGLLVQLDHEERQLLPLAARHLTGTEWRQIGEHVSRSLPTSAMPLLLGLTLEDATPDEQAVVLGHVRWPARMVMRLCGFRRYRRYVRRIRGG